MGNKNTFCYSYGISIEPFQLYHVDRAYLMNHLVIDDIKQIFESLYPVDFHHYWILSDLRVRKKGWMGQLLRLVGIGKIPYVKKNFYKIDIEQSALHLRSLVALYIQNEGSLNPKEYPPLEMVLEVCTKFNHLIDSINSKRGEEDKLSDDLKIDIAEIVVKSNLHEQIKNYESHLSFLRGEIPEYLNFPQLQEQIQEMIDWPLPSAPSPQQPRRAIEDWVHALKERMAANSGRLESLKEEKFRQQTLAVLEQIENRIEECSNLEEDSLWDYAKDLQRKLKKRLEELFALKKDAPQRQFASEFAPFKGKFEELDEKCATYLISIRSSLKERQEALLTFAKEAHRLSNVLLKTLEAYRGKRHFAKIRARIQALLTLAELPPPPAASPSFKFEEWFSERQGDLQDAFSEAMAIDLEAEALQQKLAEKRALLVETAEAMHVKLEDRDSLKELVDWIEKTAESQEDWRLEALLALQDIPLEQAQSIAPSLIGLYQESQLSSLWLKAVTKMQQSLKEERFAYLKVDYRPFFDEMQANLYYGFSEKGDLLFILEGAKETLEQLWSNLFQRQETILKLILSTSIEGDEADLVARPFLAKLSDLLTHLELLIKREGTAQQHFEPFLEQAKEIKSWLAAEQKLDRNDIEKIHRVLIEGELLLQSH
ncbi:MAG: hypothetical protein K0S07_47 [Chlamydiales bacterium]|nr:hypothetical protein [Chlamydiales bacterium]